MNQVGSDEIERLADLAGLDVDRSELGPLAREIAEIIQYVSQIEATAEPGGFHQVDTSDCGSGVPLRRDEADRSAHVIDPTKFAPDFQYGFFIVPRPESIGE